MKHILFLLAVVAGLVCHADYVIPSAKMGEAKWWQTRQNLEVINWIDHYGKINAATRKIGSTNVVTSSNGRYCRIKISSDLVVLSYTVDSAGRVDTNDFTKVAPATYDLVNGKFYTQLTDAEKKALWDAYDKKVADRLAAEEAERNAPAKFDVSLTPDEYKAKLMGDRDPETLTPMEKRELAREMSTYRAEWTRIHEPEKLILPLPFNSNYRSSEQTKRKRRLR